MSWMNGNSTFRAASTALSDFSTACWACYANFWIMLISAVVWLWGW